MPWPSQWPRQPRISSYLWLAVVVAMTAGVLAETDSTFTVSGVSEATAICASAVPLMGGLAVVSWSSAIRVRHRRPTAIRLVNDPNTGEAAVRIPHYAPLVFGLAVALIAGMVVIASTATVLISEALSQSLSLMELIEGLVLAGLAALIAAFFIECFWHRRVAGRGVFLSTGGIRWRRMFRDDCVSWEDVQEIYAASSGGDFQKIAVRCSPGSLPTRHPRPVPRDMSSFLVERAPIHDNSVMLVHAVALAADPALILNILSFYHRDGSRRAELASQASIDRIRTMGGSAMPDENESAAT